MSSSRQISMKMCLVALSCKSTLQLLPIFFVYVSRSDRRFSRGKHSWMYFCPVPGSSENGETDFKWWWICFRLTTMTQENVWFIHWLWCSVHLLRLGCQANKNKYVCMRMGGVFLVHLGLALPTCLFCCSHDSQCHARPTPLGCYSNVPFFWLVAVNQVYLPAGNDRWMVGASVCVCVSVSEQINQNHWASRRVHWKEHHRDLCFFPNTDI